MADVVDRLLARTIGTCRMAGVCVAALLAVSTGPSFAQTEPYLLGTVRQADGSLLSVDRNLPGVWQSRDGKATHFVTGERRFRTPLNAARCIALDADGNVLVGDTSTRDVYRITDGKPVPLTGGGIGMPMAIAVAKDGTIFVADLELHRIFRIVPGGGDNGAGKAEEFAVVSAPRGLAFDPQGHLIVVSTTKDQIIQLDADGKATVLVSGNPFNFPHNIAINAEGTMFVTDGYGKCVWKIGADHQPVKLVEGAPFVNPVGITTDGEKLLVTDPRAGGVFEVDAAGKVTPVETGVGK